jgi:hypothetical protein
VTQSERNTLESVVGLIAAKRKELEKIEARAILGFRGSFDDLESAIGMLRLGHHFGWKVVHLVHSKATVRKYEGILGIKIRDLFQAEGPSSYRSKGFELSLAVGNFWKIVSGAIKLEKRRDISR